jgi:hypothetical protein
MPSRTSITAHPPPNLELSSTVQDSRHLGLTSTSTLFFRFAVLALIVTSGLCASAQEVQVRAQTPTSTNQESTQQQTSPPDGGKTSAQSTTPSQPETPKEKKKKVKGRGAFVVAPLPISSPAIGSGIIPLLGYIFPFSTHDKISPPSTIGAAGLITNNGSRGFAVGGQLFLKENRYEVTAGFAHGNVNYDIYSARNANIRLPLVQTGEAFFGEFLRRIGWKFFVGPRFVTGRSFLTVMPNNVSNFPIPPEIGLHSNLTSIGVRLNRDTRPNHFYPVTGTFFTFTSDFFSEALGSKYTFQSYKTVFDKYWSLNKKQVIAYDANFCATGGAAPFYGNCIYGTNNELRGYVAGRYFTRYAITTQVEYRLVLPKRFGVVAFGGLGGTIPAGSQLLQRAQTSHFLPSGGGGLRFELSKQYHVNLRADIAQGRDGHTFALGVGEAF